LPPPPDPVPDPEVPLPLVPELPDVPPPVAPPVPPTDPEELLGAVGVTTPPLLEELGLLELLLVPVPDEVIGEPHSLKP
jgi:hypothetical protein